MKKNLLRLLCFCLSLVMISCGSKKLSNKTIKVNNVAISGQGKDYFKVVDGDYEVKVVDDKIVIPLKLELLKNIGTNNNVEFGNLSLSPLDKSGAAIADLGLDFKLSTSSDYDKVRDLVKGKQGDQISINFEWSYFSDKEKQKRIITEIEGIELTRSDFTGTDKSSSVDNSSSTSSSASESKDDCDKFISDYEEFVKNYIVVFKKYKANPTDPSILTEYTDLASKATEMQAGAKDCTDPKYASKLLKLNTKMASAMSGM